ncbi:hypothetical protein R1sor_003325 [Riccia sorocarpa]|uniref:Uncharacterized protein n=1 Tax=Riccia sorocarpa TaxID=122646 RepID=A0ABD3H1N7_9MARC
MARTRRPARARVRPVRAERGAGRGRGRGDAIADPVPAARGQRGGGSCRGTSSPCRRGDPDPPVEDDESSESAGEESASEAEAEPEEDPEAKAEEGGGRRQRRHRRDAEGASLVPHQITPDAELYLKWGWVRTEDIQPVLDEMDDQEIMQLGFVQMLGHDFQQPHFASCLEFIRSYNAETHIGTVGGTEVTLSRQVIRDTFGLPHGYTPFDMKIRHLRIMDWFPVRDVAGKRYFAFQCARGGAWLAFFQLLNMILLARRRYKCVPAHVIQYVQAKIDGPSHNNYDLASFAFESLHSELVAVRHHLDLTRHVRFMECF